MISFSQVPINVFNFGKQTTSLQIFYEFMLIFKKITNYISRKFPDMNGLWEDFL